MSVRYLTLQFFFLKEGCSPGIAQSQREGMLVRSYEVFHNVDEELKEGGIPISTRNDISTLLHSNYASYFQKRKKLKAASQRTQKANNCWNQTKRGGSDSLVTWALRLRDATTKLQCGAIEEAAHALKAIVQTFSAKPSEDGQLCVVENANQQTRSEETILMEVTCQFSSPSLASIYENANANSSEAIAAKEVLMRTYFSVLVHHNLAVAYTGLRNYSQASVHSQNAVKLVQENEPLQFLFTHAHKLQMFCSRMCHESTYAQYRMKSEEHTTQGSGSLKSFIQTAMHLPQVDAIMEMQKHMERRQKVIKEKQQSLRDQADQCLPNALTAQVYIPNTTSHHPPKKPQIKDIVKTNLQKGTKVTSYAQLIEDYSAEIERYQRFLSGEKEKGGKEKMRPQSQGDKKIPKPPDDPMKSSRKRDTSKNCDTASPVPSSVKQTDPISPASNTTKPADPVSPSSTASTPVAARQPDPSNNTNLPAERKYNDDDYKFSDDESDGSPRYSENFEDPSPRVPPK
eukprot:PhF_6_TR8439/c0_g1_i2/m.13154